MPGRKKKTGLGVIRRSQCLSVAVSAMTLLLMAGYALAQDTANAGLALAERARRTPATPLQMALRLEKEQAMGAGILMPDPERQVRLSGGVIPLDDKTEGFPAEFFKGLVPDEINGVEAWRATLRTDDASGDMLFYNADGEVFWWVAADAAVWSADWIARLHSTDSKAADFFSTDQVLKTLSERQTRVKLSEEALYRSAWLSTRQYLLPSHVEMTFTFILKEDIDAYRAAGAAARSPDATVLSMPMSMSAPLTGLAVTGFAADTNGVALSAAWPTGTSIAGDALDIFFTRTLIPPAWSNLWRVAVDPAAGAVDVAIPCAELPPAPETPPAACVTNIVPSAYDPGVMVTNIVCTNGVWLTDSGFFRLADLADTDGDGLTDACENWMYGTRPDLIDTDGDTLDDGWEIKYGINPFVQDDPAADPDNDGLTHAEECAAGTDPFNGDTDGDTLGDGAELGCVQPSYGEDKWINTPFWPNLLYKTWPDPVRNWKNVPLPFPLQAGGRALSNVTINASGMLAFHDSSLTNCLYAVYDDNLPLASPALGTQVDTNSPLIVAAFWDDLQLVYNEASYVRMAEVTTNGTRRCVIEYVNMNVRTPQYGDGGRVSFQIAFTEGVTNRLSVCYRDTSGGYATGRSATFGFVSPDTTLQVAYNLIGSVYSGLCLNYFLGPGTDPLNSDTDSDTLADGIEYAAPLHTDPRLRDTDGDGLTDGEENDLGTNPLVRDTDGDGLPDGWEVRYLLNPLIPDTDIESDGDGDGLTLAQEAMFGTDPGSADTDDDGLGDDDEVFTVRAGNAGVPWFDVSGGTNLFPGTSGSALDYGNKAMSLPFPFTAGRVTLTHLSANANGLIGLYGAGGSSLTSSYTGNGDLEADDAVDFGRVSLAVAAFWDDLRLYPTQLWSSVTMADVHTNGNRFCVIEYRNAGFTGAGQPSATNRVSFQVAFAEGVSNRLTVLFKDTYGKGDGRSATLGAQTASQYTQYSYNAATVSNGLELVYALGYGTDPLVRDSDGDEVTDGDEAYTHCTDPLAIDTDGDGLTDGWEVGHSSNPLLTDTDGDTLPDGWEATYSWPLTVFNDPGADPDGDGLNNVQEAALGTNPEKPDTDDDELGDGDECSFVQITDGGLDGFDVSGGIPLFEAVTVASLSSGCTNVALPFPVTFDGLTMTGLSVNLKGIIGLFGDGQSGLGSGGRSSNLDLRTADLADYGSGLVVAGLWDNLYVYRASNSSVTLSDISTNGHRYCVVDYKNMRVNFTTTNNLASFQIVFTEGLTNRVSVLYRLALGNGDGRTATLGILSASHAIQYSYNTNSVAPGLELTYRVGTDTDPLAGDTDSDGLSDRDEIVLWQTDPFVADTDGDLWLDGWEAQNYDPVTGAFDPRVLDAWDADPDNDGLTNVEEFDNGTNPTKPDTDNDLRPDGAEVAGASDPRSAASTEPQASVPVHIWFGDLSPSNSEKYKLIVTPLSGDDRGEMTRVNREFGKPEHFDVPLVKGARYRIELEHHSTNLEAGPDCDYTLTVSNALISCSSNERQGGTGIIAPGVFLVAEDPDGLLGTHATAPADTPFEGAGKSVILTLHSIDIVQTNLFGCPHCLANTEFTLTNSYAPGGVIWAISPQMPGGATIAGNGQTAVFHPGTVGTNYTVTATSAAVPACSDTAHVTVCVPGPITVKCDSYIDDDPAKPGESHKIIFHSFYPTPANSDSANHFVFVQYIRGYALNSDGSYPQVENMYGLTNTTINFLNYVIDSNSDDDPAYGTYPAQDDLPAVGRPGHEPGSNINEYYVADDVNVADYSVGSKCDLQFKIGIYCTRGVPLAGASVNVGVGIPFSERTWLFQFTATTNAIGEKVFTHP